MSARSTIFWSRFTLCFTPPSIAIATVYGFTVPKLSPLQWGLVPIVLVWFGLSWHRLFKSVRQLEQARPPAG